MNWYMGTLIDDKGTSRCTTRAVLRDVEPGSTIDCTHCGEQIRFNAKARPKQVICNVYEKKRWNRVEHFHETCYQDAHEPHGEVDTTPPPRNRRSIA